MSVLYRIVRKGVLAVSRLRQRRLVQSVNASRCNPAAKHYVDDVRVSIILQFFNKRANIGDLHQTMRDSLAEEVIVCDDGSVDGSYGDWLALLTRPNDFLVRTNDIFEVRTYERCMGMARGEFVVLLQDDDVAADRTGRWLSQAIEIMNSDPTIVVLGGRTGSDLEKTDAGGFTTVESAATSRQLGYRYVAAVNRAPWIIRASSFRQLGGIDQSFAPFQHDDLELCLRAWQRGMRVAHYEAGFVRDVGTGGMRLFNDHGGDYEKDWKWRKAVRNWEEVQERYAGAVDRICELVDEANATLGGKG